MPYLSPLDSKKIPKRKKVSNSLFVPNDSVSESSSFSFNNNNANDSDNINNNNNNNNSSNNNAISSTLPQNLIKSDGGKNKPVQSSSWKSMVNKIPKEKSKTASKRSKKDREMKKGAEALMGLIKKTDSKASKKAKGKEIQSKKTNLSTLAQASLPTAVADLTSSFSPVCHLNPSSAQDKKLSLLFNSFNNNFSRSKSSHLSDPSSSSLVRNSVLSRNWCFTVHNPDLNPPYLDTPTFWIDQRLYSQLDWQYEQGKKSNSIHIQGSIRFRQAKKMDFVIKQLIPTSMKIPNPKFKENKRVESSNLPFLINEKSKTKIFWTLSNHSYEKSSSYCHKSSTALQPSHLTPQPYDPASLPVDSQHNNNKIVDLSILPSSSLSPPPPSPPSSFNNDPSFPFSGSLGESKKQGSRTDIFELKSFIDNTENCTIQSVAENFFSSFLRYRPAIQSYVLSKAMKRDFKSEVTLLFGAAGTGKSRFAQFICSENGTKPYYVKDHSKWYDNFDGISDIIYDDFYGSMQFSQLLQILDRYPINVEVKCGVINFAPQRIFITSNKWYLFWYMNSNKSHSLPDIKVRMEALYRRIENILVFQADGTVTVFKGEIPKLRSEGFKVKKNLCGRSNMEKELNPERFKARVGQSLRLYIKDTNMLDEEGESSCLEQDSDSSARSETFDPTFNYIYSSNQVNSMDDDSFLNFSKNLDNFFMLNLLPRSELISQASSSSIDDDGCQRFYEKENRFKDLAVRRRKDPDEENDSESDPKPSLEEKINLLNRKAKEGISFFPASSNATFKSSSLAGLSNYQLQKPYQSIEKRERNHKENPFFQKNKFVQQDPSSSDQEDFSSIFDLLESNPSSREKKQMVDDIENDYHLLFSSDEESSQAWNQSDEDFINDKNEYSSCAEEYHSSSSGEDSEKDSDGGGKTSNDEDLFQKKRKRKHHVYKSFNHARFNNKIEKSVDKETKAKRKRKKMEEQENRCSLQESFEEEQQEQTNPTGQHNTNPLFSPLNESRTLTVIEDSLSESEELDDSLLIKNYTSIDPSNEEDDPDAKTPVVVISSEDEEEDCYYDYYSEEEEEEEDYIEDEEKPSLFNDQIEEKRETVDISKEEGEEKKDEEIVFTSDEE